VVTADRRSDYRTLHGARRCERAVHRRCRLASGNDERRTVEINLRERSCDQARRVDRIHATAQDVEKIGSEL
jgi:hypothetical protein